MGIGRHGTFIKKRSQQGCDDIFDDVTFRCYDLNELKLLDKFNLKIN